MGVTPPPPLPHPRRAWGSWPGHPSGGYKVQTLSPLTATLGLVGGYVPKDPLGGGPPTC